MRIESPLLSTYSSSGALLEKWREWAISVKLVPTMWVEGRKPHNIEFQIPINFCPMCGRDLKDGEQ